MAGAPRACGARRFRLWLGRPSGPARRPWCGWCCGAGWPRSRCSPRSGRRTRSAGCWPTLAGDAPGWLARADQEASAALGGHGLAASVLLAVLMAVIGVAGCRPDRAPAAARAAVAAAVVFGLVAAAAGGFGELFTGMATDPGTGPVLALFALAYWPSRLALTASAGSADPRDRLMPRSQPIPAPPAQGQAHQDLRSHQPLWALRVRRSPRRGRGHGDNRAWVAGVAVRGGDARHRGLLCGAAGRGVAVAAADRVRRGSHPHAHGDCDGRDAGARARLRPGRAVAGDVRRNRMLVRRAGGTRPDPRRAGAPAQGWPGDRRPGTPRPGRSCTCWPAARC